MSGSIPATAGSPSMKIPRQEDLAVLVMSELARSYNIRLVPLSEIANRHGVSSLFLKKIVSLLKKSELVRSKEGVGGGYALAKSPTRISVWDIMQAVGGLPFNASSLSTSTSCPLNESCLPQTISRTISHVLEHGLSDINLLQLGKSYG